MPGASPSPITGGDRRAPPSPKAGGQEVRQKAKKPPGFRAAFVLCGRTDLNRHRIAPTSTSSLRVYHFTTTAKSCQPLQGVGGAYSPAPPAGAAPGMTFIWVGPTFAGTPPPRTLLAPFSSDSVATACDREPRALRPMRTTKLTIAVHWVKIGRASCREGV